MAGTSLLALIDDIATLLDDVAVLTKVAAKKTAGVLGDDLALNAQQVAGVKPDRELPVVWAVAKGSFKNKLILVPIALALSAFLPWAITPLLMLGGAYLCYEGFEKVMHSLFHHSSEKKEHQELLDAVCDESVDLVCFEEKKIKGAIRTDFILSAEIIVITLGAAKAAPFLTQVIIVSLIAVVITVGVYGLVAGIVKMDDVGLHLQQSSLTNQWGKFKRTLGSIILSIAPKLMKTLSIVGTIAMFLVGGGILLHGIPQAHDLIHYVETWAAQLPFNQWLEFIAPIMMNLVTGLIAGGILVATLKLLSPVMARVFPRSD